MSEKRSAKKQILKLSAVILAMYAVFAVSLYISYSEMRFDLAERDADTEYLSILETGGVSGGAHNERNIYNQDGRYYLELKERHGRDEKYELTKEEYILCTDVDTDYLKDAPRSTASDSFVYEITVRKNGEEINIPPRSYATQYFGNWRFVRDSRQKAPAGQISYETYIRYLSYIFSRGTGYALLRYLSAADPDNKVYQVLQTEKTNVDYIELKELYDEACHAAGVLRSEQTKPKWIDEREQLISECLITDYYGEKAYYKEYSSKSFSCMILACPAYNDSIVFLYERPESITPERYNDDIRCILSGGSPYEKYTHTFLAGSAVFLLLFVTAAAGMKKSAKTDK